MARFTNVGILIASGMIAGEALMGLVTNGIALASEPLTPVLKNPSFAIGVAVMALLAVILILVPLRNAGDPNEPAPPTAMM